MDTPRFIAFAGSRCVAAGDLASVARETKRSIEGGEQASILIFDAVTSRPVEIDFRGTVDDVLQRLTDAARVAAPAGRAPELDEPAPPRGPGRPRLGVVAREVTLLPRHWDWLNQQPGGASVALRKLVEEARRLGAPADRAREARESAYRFLSTMAGNEPGFEEATRALFAGERARFDALVAPWPVDVRDHARRLAALAFDAAGVAA